MSVPDDLITRYLGQLLGKSDPGDALHTMITAAAEPAHHTPLGLPDPDKLYVSVFAIAPCGPVDAEQFISQTITMAILEAKKKQSVIHFAGLAREVHAVPQDGSEVTENLARRLKADRKLRDHPAAVEVTQLYAACSDGRRWTGEHYLTGPRAGTVVGPELRVGRLAHEEMGTHQYLIRLAVGHGTR